MASTAKSTSKKVDFKDVATKTLFSALKKDGQPLTKNLIISKQELSKKVSQETK